MKSIQRPSKPSKQQPKVINPNSGETAVIETVAEQSLPNDSTVELIQEEETIVKKLVVKPIAKSAVKRKSEEQSPREQWQKKPSEFYTEESELPPEPCQHIQFLDCNSEVGRIIFECYHCQQGIISEYSGGTVMGEYKGKPSVILAKVKCPNCEQTAIRLQAREVISTTAIPSPWR